MQERVYAYIRTSTVKQGTEGVSLDAQREAITAYAIRHRLEIVDWFSETQTAAKQGRPVFSRMMKELRRRRVGGLILHRIDRGSRNLKDWSDIADLADQGITVHFAHDSLDLGTRGGRLAADVQAVVAADFIRNLREETLKGMRGRLKQGLWPWAAPPGYLDCGKAQPKEVDPIRGPLVRKAFELYATGTYNLHTLRDTLFEKGLRTSSGKRLSLHGMSAILNNPFYYGLLRVEKWGESFTGIHTPLLTKELSERVQDVLHGRTQQRGLKHNPLYRKTVQCSGCGYRLIGEVQKGHIYYRCHTRSCAPTCVREEAISTAIRSSLELFSVFAEAHPDLAPALKERLADRRTEKERMATALRTKLGQIGERLDALTDAMLDGTVDRDLYLMKKNALVEERLRTEGKLRETQLQSAFAQIPAVIYLELLDHLKNKVILEQPRKALEVAREGRSNFTATQKRIVVQWAQPLNMLCEEAFRMSSDPGYCADRTLEEWVSLLLNEETGTSSSSLSR
jgi:DNA invertase Pin-like site-specific DNA recombinase